MPPDPCLPADLAPRPMHDLVAKGRGLGLLTALIISPSQLREFKSLTYRWETNHWGRRRLHDHCSQLDVPFSDLPMCL